MLTKVTKDTWPNVKAIPAILINMHEPLLYNTPQLAYWHLANRRLNWYVSLLIL